MSQYGTAPTDREQRTSRKRARQGSRRTGIAAVEARRAASNSPGADSRPGSDSFDA